MHLLKLPFPGSSRSSQCSLHLSRDAVASCTSQFSASARNTSCRIHLREGNTRCCKQRVTVGFQVWRKAFRVTKWKGSGSYCGNFSTVRTEGQCEIRASENVLTGTGWMLSKGNSLVREGRFMCSIGETEEKERNGSTKVARRDGEEYLGELELQNGTDVRNTAENGRFSEEEREEAIDLKDVKVLARFMTKYNFVRVLEISRRANHPMAGARVLLLDKPGNVHSVYQKYKLLTDSYYDVFATLPPIIPEGPIGILGLAGGTAARLVHHFWPEIDMYGWELDPGVVDVARRFFDLEELEWSGMENNSTFHNEDSTEAPFLRQRDASGNYIPWEEESDGVRSSFFMDRGNQLHARGRLRVLVADALGPDVMVTHGFAGLIVDLFANGAVIPELQQPGTWREMRKKLLPGGRLMVNCGGSCVDAGVGNKDGRITMEETVAAIASVFPGELSVLNLRNRGDNIIALTGPPPTLHTWKSTLPECLGVCISDWIPRRK